MGLMTRALKVDDTAKKPRFQLGLRIHKPKVLSLWGIIRPLVFKKINIQIIKYES
jgi:hypothetical protein